MKEIKLSPNIGINDLSYRIVQANEFLKKGLQVKVSLVFKGRENIHESIGYSTLSKFLEWCDGVPASNLRMILGKRKQLVVTLNPKKK